MFHGCGKRPARTVMIRAEQGKPQTGWPGRDEKGREVIGFAALKHDRQDENRFRDEIMLHDRDYGYGGYSI